MAAPEYVPVKPMDDVRTYESPPRRPDPWIPRRPGEVHGENPRGYGIMLAKRLSDRLHLQHGEALDDVVAGCLGVGLKRASLLGRAPVIHDFTAAFTMWGFLDPQPPAHLVQLRTPAFAEVARPAHYGERRRIVAAARNDQLRQPHTVIADRYATDWRGLLDTAVLEHTAHG